ncbi:replicase [Molossus molossus circovirus 1]|uniref:replicase n=1 Tax=Molossus molossus circovirus 1 TaxID=1959842 RepID=UPI000CA26B1C|nr:replicase [Molossus molossus circovirus 1]AQR57897.1 replicase [Molossus molossus circovirus 1]
MQARAYCFTLNNPTELLDLEDGHVRYAIYQEEIGDNGTNHFQGYIEFDRPTRLGYCKRLIPGAHFEQRRGTREEAREYCRKPDTRVGEVFETGVWNPTGQGNRTDYDGLKQLLVDGATTREVLDQMPSMFFRYHSAIGKAQLLLVRDRDWPTLVIVCYGASGTGKSRWARDYCDASNSYWVSNTKWFDGYESQPVVVLDDFRGWLPLHQLLRLCDRYPYTVEWKGGSRKFVAHVIIITSTRRPDEWYNWEDLHEDPVQLFRRIDQFYHFIPGDICQRDAATFCYERAHPEELRLLEHHVTM